MGHYNKTLLEFMRRIDLDDALLYKDNASAQEIFVRDKVAVNLLNISAFVVSTHHSKSCLLPVYGLYLPNGMIVYMRENFYGWVVSIDSPFEFSLPTDFVYGEYDKATGRYTESLLPGYCEGFKDAWTFPFAINNTKQSTFRIHDNYQLYTLLYLLKKQGETIMFGDMSNDEIRTTAHNMLNNHADDDIWSMFLKTYKAVEKSEHIFLGADDIDKFVDIVLSNPDIRSQFVQECQLFHKGEALDFNNEDWLGKTND